MRPQSTFRRRKEGPGAGRGFSAPGGQFPEKFRVPLDLVGQLEACGTRRTEISLWMPLHFEILTKIADIPCSTAETAEIGV